MKKNIKLPKRLYIIRHARSLPNEKLEQAKANGAEFFELPMPEHLAPIVEAGHREVSELSSWLLQVPEQERPSKIVSSTHTRTRQTAEGIVEKAGLAVPLIYDSRFIERRWGAIGGLTDLGFERLFPVELERRARLGEFRYRPPLGGENLRDVKKRIKPALQHHLAASHDENLALVTHSQVILVLRQLLEGLSERKTLELDERLSIPNCSVCLYVRQGRKLVIEQEYFVAPKL